MKFIETAVSVFILTSVPGTAILASTSPVTSSWGDAYISAKNEQFTATPVITLPTQQTPVAPQPVLLAPHLDGQHIEPGQAPTPVLPPQKTPVKQIAVDPIQTSVDGSATALKTAQATHLDGQHNQVINGRDGRPGKDGVTTIITRNVTDTAAVKQINTLTTQTAGQAQELNAARQMLIQQQKSSNAQFKSLKDDVDDNKKESRSGIAGAVAIASMPQVERDQTFMVSAGAGTFHDESAVAVGASFHAGEHAIVKAGVTTTTNNDYAVGAGIGLGW